MIDRLREAEKALLDRLTELEPLVDEYHRLREEAERLGLSVGQPGRPAPSSRPDHEPAEPKVSPSRARTRKPAAKPALPAKPSALPGERADGVLALVSERPGITVAQVGKELGVDPASLYRVVRKLETDGHLLKKGRMLQPRRHADASAGPP